MGTGFFNTPPSRESEPSRPKYINPRTGEVQSWQRASNFAAPLENPFGLTRHHGRQIVRGFNVRADLARMALTGAIDGDKVDEVITTALTAAESEAKANNGTAVHAALGLCDTGADVPEEYWPHARGYVAELKRWGLRPVAVEQRILNTRLGATGSFDRVYVTDSGRYLIGDIKTGRVDHAHKFAVQCEVYAGADFVVHEKPGAAPITEPLPWPLDQDAALLIHVDPDTGATAVYEVPLRVARWGAALAEQVRAFQRTDVLLPYSGAPSGPLAEQLRREAVHEMRTPAEIGQEADEHNRAQAFGHDQATEASTQIPGGSVPLVPTTAGAAPVTPSGVVAPAHVQPAESSTAPTSGAATASPSDAPLTEVEIEAARKLKINTTDPVTHVRRMLALLVTKNDKAKLQRMLSDLGGTDLAHNRKWLAERIIAAQDGTGGSATAVAQTIEQGVPAGEATPFLLKQLADAATVADIERIHANVVTMSGESAWTPAMQEVAQTRHAELIGPRIDQAPQGSPLTRIADAKSTQDLARVWEDVTRNGAEVNAWTPAYDKAAKERGAALQASVPANPNPWGNS